MGTSGGRIDDPRSAVVAALPLPAQNAAATAISSVEAMRARIGGDTTGDTMGAETRRSDGEDARDAADGEAPFRAEPGSLYVVATPLGNLADLTFRARAILASVDVIAAEDTRVTSRLLARYGIATRATPLHAHNEARRSADVVALLDRGKSVALVTDAGTPGISDPGARLVAAARAAGRRVIPIPGPSAVAAAVSVAGLSAERFVFVGFLPETSKARRELLAQLGLLPLALVVYEAPHRIRGTIAELARALPDREIVVARELTKTFETIVRLPIAQVEEWLAADANRQRGEFVLVIDGPSPSRPAPEIDAQAERWLASLVGELSPARAARVAAAATGLSRDALYARACALARQGR